MKANVYDMKGMKKSEMALPSFFDSEIRSDLVRKAVEFEKNPQPYGLYREAGRRHSASGIISHKRHDWKGQYGRGIARTPRKILWRRGTQFNWVGAEVSNTRGGRRPHGPKPSFAETKMNKKEYALALRSAIAATGRESFITSRYERLEKMPIALPAILEFESGKSLTKRFKFMIEKLFGAFSPIVFVREDVRAGRGKLRGRRYKKSAGALIITGAGEKVNIGSVASVSVKEISVGDLYPLGRIVFFTKKAAEEIASL